MTSPPPKDSRIGKGYSYLFALSLTLLLACQSTSVDFKIDNKGDYHFAIASRELNLNLFYPCVGLIASIIGLPTDAIALALGQILSKGRGE